MIFLLSPPKKSALPLLVAFLSLGATTGDSSHARLPHFVAETPIYYPGATPDDPYPAHGRPPAPYAPPKNPYYGAYGPYPLPPTPPSPPPPRYGKAKCTTKEWSTETELCKPEITEHCERLEFRVRKVRDPKTECNPSMIPKCKIDQSVKEARLCNTRVLKKRAALHATLYEQVMVVRCNTHYETKCERGAYRYKPTCYSVPVQVGRNKI